MGPVAFLVALVVTSFGAGIVGAVLGLGGGILLVPLLTMVFGINLHDAMGASLVSVIATSSGAAAMYLRSGLSNIRLGLFLAMATVTGALMGAALSGVVPARILELILGLALAYSVVVTLRQLKLELPETLPYDPLAMRFGLEGTYDDQRLGREVKYRADRVKAGVAVMWGAGMLSGLLGIGSGAFKVLALDYVMRLPMKVSTATSNFMIGITAAASGAVYFGRGDINPMIATPVALGIMLGATVGTSLIGRLRNTTVRALFLPVIVYLALSMIARGLGLVGS
jgi:uncharacterized membrane protein YfcA